MWRNYLKIAVRNLLKFRFYTLINVVGLAAGITAFLFLFLYVKEEVTYDRFHPLADRIYRVDVDGRLADQELISAENAAPLGPTMLADFPEVEAFMRFRSRGSFLVKYNNQHHREDEVVFADSTLFRFFALKLAQGQEETALRNPNTMVISQRAAEKYFGTEDPMGKALVLDNEENYTVTGVLAPTPANTDFSHDFFIAMSTLDESRNQQWGSMNFHSFVLLRKGVDAQAFAAKMSPYLIEKYFGPEVEKYIGQSWSDFTAAGNDFKYELFPLKDIHLYSDKDNEMRANGDIKYVWIFSLIGIFILLIACINFVNLATARSALRAKEVGIRKVVGAQKRHLFTQFLSESFLLSFVALCLAIGLIGLLFPYFNALAGKTLTLSQLNTPALILTALLLIPVLALLAGSYPAAYLSRFRPVKVLKGSVGEGRSKDVFRNSLVVFQFLITTALISGTLVVYSQLQFIQNKKLGFERDRLLILNDVYALEDQLEVYKTKAISYPEVEKATVSGFLPVPSYRNSTSFSIGRDIDPEKTIILNNWDVDEDYIPTMGMELAAGRNFSTDFPSDSTAVIINQRMTKYFGEQDPIGQAITTYGDDDEIVTFRVIGVIKDFHFSSLRHNIEPLGLFLQPSRGYLTLRVNSQDMPSTIQKLEADWRELAPDQPFDYGFMDERFNRMYERESQVGKIISAFAILAIFIACIGLLGLVSFAAQQRTKEIGIRKVLGASVTTIVGLLSKDFIRLILIALTLAIPITWYVMSKWLQNFAYQIDLPWWVFAVAGATAIGIALLTVSFQTIRAALANPVESLRSE